MALAFPSSPTVSQTYTSGTRTWTWNGTAWKLPSTMLTGVTGTGNAVLSVGPTITLANATGLPLTTGVTGVLPAANGGTGVTTSTGTGSVVLSANPTFTGTVNTAAITASGNIGVSGTLSTAAYTETIVALNTVGAAATLAITAGTFITATLTSATACTFTMPTIAAGKSFILYLRQPAAGTATTATFTNVKWGVAGAPTITATVGKMDILSFSSDGTAWYGAAAQGYTY